MPEQGAGDAATLAELWETARGQLPSTSWNYLEGGAGAEDTLRANTSAFADWEFLPRVLTGLDPPSCATTVLGIPVSLPVLTAPFGKDWLWHPDGQLALSRATERVGTGSIVPRGSMHSLEDVAAAAPGSSFMLQLLAVGSRDLFVEIGGRAREAGYRALCVTVDGPTRGWRERLLRDRYAADFSEAPASARGAVDQLGAQLHGLTQRMWGWDDLAAACAEVGLPFLVKGVLTGQDALRAERAGACGVFVSNHGGRQLDGVPAALTQLPEVGAAVGGRLLVGLDSGIRRGADVVKALALGADVVAVGRLAAVALVAGGEAGVVRMFELLRAEMLTVLALLGRDGVADLDPSAVRRRSCGCGTAGWAPETAFDPPDSGNYDQVY